METIQYDEQLHSTLLEVGRELETRVSHELELPFVESIMATLDYFGANQAQMSLIKFDLLRAQYKIFDFLGMAYTGRLNDPSDSIASQQVHNAIEKMVKLYILQKHVGGFAWFLRGHDLDIEEPSRCEDCIKSYDEWRAEQ